jgi:hypothetical protein
MKKLLILALLTAIPALQGFAQVHVSALAGKDGYSVLRANGDFSVFPGLSLTPSYSAMAQDNKNTMHQYGLGARAKVPFFDLAEVGAQGYYVPKANDYSNYSYDLHAALNIENILLRILPSEEFKVGAGFRQIRHSFYKPDYQNTENDIYGFIQQKYGRFDAELNYTKAVSFSNSADKSPEWLDVPYFNVVIPGYLDYSLGASLGYTYLFFRPFVAYNIIKLQNNEETDDAKAGVTVKVAMVNVNAGVEWLNFSKNSAERKTFYTLSAGLSLF